MSLKYSDSYSILEQKVITATLVSKLSDLDALLARYKALIEAGQHSVAESYEVPIKEYKYSVIVLLRLFFGDARYQYDTESYAAWRQCKDLTWETVWCA